MTDKKIIAAVLRELAEIFGNAESEGNHMGFDEHYEVDIVKTLQGLGVDLQKRAEQLEKEAKEQAGQ